VCLLDLCMRRLRSQSQNGSWTLLQLHAEYTKQAQVRQCQRKLPAFLPRMFCWW
jgi:hypothetical protein